MSGDTGMTWPRVAVGAWEADWDRQLQGATFHVSPLASRLRVKEPRNGTGLRPELAERSRLGSVWVPDSC